MKNSKKSFFFSLLLFIFASERLPIYPHLVMLIGFGV